MIKRIRFSPSGDPIEAGAPDDVRPVRVAVCTAVSELSAGAEHDRLALEWFTDLDHLDRFEASTGADASAVVAEEHLVRGAEWLDEWWGDGGDRFVHVSVAHRAAGLSAADFAARWRAHAGMAGGTVIPDAARGCAYVQDHPCRPSAYDAVSEAWFDDLDGLRARVEWFQANGVGRAPDDLFGPSWSVAVRAAVVPLP